MKIRWRPGPWGQASPVLHKREAFSLKCKEKTTSASTEAEGQVLTALVGGLHGLCRQPKLAHEGPQLPRGQGRAEHAQGLQGRARRLSPCRELGEPQGRSAPGGLCCSGQCPPLRAHSGAPGPRAYLLELGRGQRVLDLLRGLRQRLPRWQVGQQALLDIRVGKDGGHDLGRQHAGQVHWGTSRWPSVGGRAGGSGHLHPPAWGRGARVTLLAASRPGRHVHSG